MGFLTVLKSPTFLLILVTLITNGYQMITKNTLKAKNANLQTKLEDARANNVVLLKSLKDQKKAIDKTRKINKDLRDRYKAVNKDLSDYKLKIITLQRNKHVKKYLSNTVPTPVYKLMLQWPGARKNSPVKGTKTRSKLGGDSS